MRNIKQLVPAVAVHPGAIVQDELEAAGFTQRSLAAEIGIQPSLLNEVIKGKRNITADLAVMLEAALGVDAEYWLNLQKNYELDLARIKESKEKKAEKVAQWQLVKNFIPYKYFISQGILQNDPQQDIDLVLSIYNASTPEIIEQRVEAYEPAYFRKSRKLKVDKKNLTGWVYAAKFLAEKQEVCAFNPVVKNQLVEDLRRAIQYNENLLETVKSLLARAGIKFIILPKPDKTPVDGLCFWSGKNPAIVLTLRHRHLDKFAFNLFHELAHVYEHLIKHPEKDFLDLDLDEDGDEINVIEDQANKAASAMLVSTAAWDEFMSSVDRMRDDFVVLRAQQLGIHPSVLVGMRCHEFKRYAWESSISREIK
ncbi:HigA family addiction module antidote protein [Pontibacter sp. FD36]|uniref:HigA family addiction module antitoxin n=1 Tax=Pontibacter sp. FD36 TaxID=2789860 RepID=UPI0018AAF6D6|nr:HigA family addiction module antitoxin [Pontibacter sp. FD36]MBF8964058.1 HigA family addiction module antidote protein [Pontibacter sp. FD36]